MTEFNLSEKQKFVVNDINTHAVYYYLERDVKEFIRRLKEITKDSMSGGCDEKIVMERIDKLAGDKL